MVELLKRREAARYLQSKYNLRTTVASLATAATRGGGPQMIHQGRYAHYYRHHLDEWAASRCSGILDSTSTPPNNNLGPAFSIEEDLGDLPESDDYRITGDKYFDEITRLIDEHLDSATDPFVDKPL